MAITAIKIGSHADEYHGPDRRVRIRCDVPTCFEAVPLTEGVGDVGSKVFRCPAHGWFGPGLNRGGN